MLLCNVARVGAVRNGPQERSQGARASEEEAGEGGESFVREAPEAVRDRRGSASQERPAPIREMAQGGAHSKAEEDPEAAVEGAPGVEPIHQDLGQEPRYISKNLAFLVFEWDIGKLEFWINNI